MLELFSKSWKGELDLTKTFWLVYVLFGMIIGFIIMIPTAVIAPQLSFNQLIDVASLIEYPYTVLSAICVWRCAKLATVGWCVTARIVVALGVISVLGDIMNIFVLH